MHGNTAALGVFQVECESSARRWKVGTGTYPSQQPSLKFWLTQGQVSQTFASTVQNLINNSIAHLCLSGYSIMQAFSLDIWFPASGLVLHYFISGSISPFGSLHSWKNANGGSLSIIVVHLLLLCNCGWKLLYSSKFQLWASHFQWVKDGRLVSGPSLKVWCCR